MKNLKFREIKYMVVSRFKPRFDCCPKIYARGIELKMSIGARQVQ